MKAKQLLKIIGLTLLAAILVAGQIAINNSIAASELHKKLMSQSAVRTVGDTLSGDLLLTGSEMTGNELSWESTDNSVAVIASDGTIECIGSGQTVITAKSGDDAVAACELSVFARSVIKLTTDHTTMGEGLTSQVNASVSGSYQTELSYTSENEQIASVDENGAITAISAGVTRIKISAYGCDSVYFTVNVSDAPDYVTISSQSLTMGAGESAQLTASLPQDSYNEIAPTFTSSDESVATVDQNGAVTAVGAGTCEITVSAYSGAQAVCTVTVGKAPSKVTMTVGDTFLYAGETVAAKVSIDSNAVCSEYTYTSSNPAIADVSSDGVITGKGHGKATITVSTYNGKKASCTVEVQIVDYMTPPTSQDVYDCINYFAAFYPELISTEVIGKSVQGRDLVLLKMGTGEKKACIVAGIHAKEDISVVFTLRCIEEYAEAYYSSTGKYGSYNLKKMLDTYTLYIVPSMNPDGLDICNAGEMPTYTQTLSETEREKYKSNANGVNLNRNFPFRWDQIISSPTEPDINSYRGDYENSEPETQAIVNLVEQNDFEWLFSMHCKGYFVYWCDCYNSITSFDRKLANRLESVCGYELCGATPLTNLGGGLENWFRYKTGNPGFCIELVGQPYNTVVNEYFAVKTAWQKTRYTFIQGMR